MADLQLNRTEFDLLGIGTVLKRNRLVVPPNQREYSWEERHVQELFQDLTGAISSGKQTYFLGVIVLTGGADGDLEIADGQQRLATTTILLAAIRDYFHSRNDQSMVGDLETFLHTFVRDTREYNPRLHLNTADHEFFMKRILESPASRSEVPPTQPSHELLNRAAELAEQHVQNILSPLSDSMKNNYLNRWLDFIEQSAQIIILKVPDDMNAYVMFETLNDRGLRVSQADLVKNYLFSEARNRLTEVQDRWSAMSGALEILDDDDATMDFVRHFLISMFGPVRERDVLEMVKCNVVGSNAAVEFLDVLRSAADDYVALQVPTHEKWSGNNVGMRPFVDSLLLLRVTPLRPLALSVLRNFSESEIRAALRRFVSWSVRWLAVGSIRSGTVETAIGTAAQKITAREIDTTAALTEILEPVLPDDARFVSAFRNQSIINSKTARYYLRCLEMVCLDKDQPEWVPNEDTVITLEHVLPRDPGDNWPNVEAAMHRTYYRRLGNMVLLGGTLNGAISNSAFTSKRSILAASSYKLTKEVSLELTWGPTQIETRQNRLARLAVQAWPLR